MAIRSFSSWLKGTKNSKSRTTNRRRSTVRLGLEALEDRLTPSEYHVTSLYDSGATVETDISTLRGAIEDASFKTNPCGDIYIDVSGTIYLHGKLPFMDGNINIESSGS